MSNGKVTVILLIVGLIKTLCKMSQYFPEPYKSFKGKIDFKVDFFNYSGKVELKNATSKLAAKSDLGSLNAEIDKMDVDKLKTAPVDLNCKLNNLVTKFL